MKLNAFAASIFTGLSVLTSGFTYAQDKNVFAGIPADASITSVTPVFSQLVRYSVPAGFRPAFDHATANSYIQEAVPVGQTVENWSEMITLTGVKGLVANPNASTKILANMLAAGFNKACPQTFVVRGMGEMKLDGRDTFAFVAGCGDNKVKGKSISEVTMFLVIKGEKDFYTLQWAQRGEPVSTAPVIDANLWKERFAKLMPLFICDRTPGEVAPYPSCGKPKTP